MATPVMISIVTPCLNRVRFIEEAVQSVLNQDYPHVEHIVVDGGSTDGTLDVLRKYPHLRVVSERDEGLYDALNKGIRLAKGSVIGHLNSDDLYEPNIFSQVASEFAADPSLDAVYGGSILFEDGPEHTRRTLVEYLMPGVIDLSLENVTIKGWANTNARFFHRRVYERVGTYRQQFPIAADRDFLLRAFLAGVKGKSLPRPFYHYRQHAGSLTMQGPSASCKARLDTLRIAEEALQSLSVPGHVRRTLTEWHAVEAGMLIFHLLRNGQMGAAARVACQSASCRWSWPFTFLALIIHRLPARVRSLLNLTKTF